LSVGLIDASVYVIHSFGISDEQKRVHVIKELLALCASCCKLVFCTRLKRVAAAHKEAIFTSAGDRCCRPAGFYAFFKKQAGGGLPEAKSILLWGLFLHLKKRMAGAMRRTKGENSRKACAKDA
jgi:hypothetical protein